MIQFHTLSLLSVPLAIALGATSALADPLPMPGAMHADGWVTEDGRILHEGEPQPASFTVHPATRGDWVGECVNRLGAANKFREPAAGYENACRAWLDYYEQTGATAQGYGFAYAIPVSLTTTEIPCPCPPPARKPRPASKPMLHDKRVKIFRY